MVPELLALKYENLAMKRTFAQQEIAKMQAVDRDLTTQQQIILGDMRKQAGVSVDAVYDPATRTFREVARLSAVKTATAFPRPADGA